VVEPGSCMLTLEDHSAWKAAEQARSASDRRYRKCSVSRPAQRPPTPRCGSP
jgi:hypothetical protein